MNMYFLFILLLIIFVVIKYNVSISSIKNKFSPINQFIYYSAAHWTIIWITSIVSELLLRGLLGNSLRSIRSANAQGRPLDLTAIESSTHTTPGVTILRTHVQLETSHIKTHVVLLTNSNCYAFTRAIVNNKVTYNSELKISIKLSYLPYSTTASHVVSIIDFENIETEMIQYKVHMRKLPFKIP